MFSLVSLQWAWICCKFMTYPSLIYHKYSLAMKRVTFLKNNWSQDLKFTPKIIIFYIVIGINLITF